MVQEQITPESIYRELKLLERALKKKGIVNDKDIEMEAENPILSGKVLADEKLLAEDWLSPEDMEAWKDL